MELMEIYNEAMAAWIIARVTSLNFDQLIDREPALIKDRGRKRNSRYWLQGRDVFEQIKGPLLKS